METKLRSRQRIEDLVRPTQSAMTDSCSPLSSGLFALVTIVAFAATLFLPAYGLAILIEVPSDLWSRMFGLLLLSPWLAMLLLLGGLLPIVRGRMLGWLGLSGGLLMFPAVAAFAWRAGFPLGIALFFLAAVYFGSWWVLVRPKLSTSCAQTREAKIA